MDAAVLAGKKLFKELAAPRNKTFIFKIYNKKL